MTKVKRGVSQGWFLITLSAQFIYRKNHRYVLKILQTNMHKWRKNPLHKILLKCKDVGRGDQLLIIHN